MSGHSERIGAENPYFPDLGHLALEFAEESRDYFLVVRIEDNRVRPERKEDWRKEDWLLMETGADLLVEAIDRELPVWECATRGLGSLHQRGWVHANAALSGLWNIHRMDKEGQSARAGLLLEDSRIASMLKGHREREKLLQSLHWIARESGNLRVAVDLFMEAEPKLSLEEKIRWLSNDDTESAIATVLAREWRSLNEVGIPFDTLGLDRQLPRLLSLLPEDRDLRLMLSIALALRSTSILLPGPKGGTTSEANRKLAREFVEHRFRSSEMERIALDRLPMRAEEVPGLES